VPALKTIQTAFVGEINVDLVFADVSAPLKDDGETICGGFEQTMGSSTAIAACAYAALGGSASFFGLAGNDLFGEYMISGLRQFGVNTDSIRRSDSTGTGVTANLTHGSARTQITFPGTISQFSMNDIDLPRLLRCAHAHFSGIFQETALRRNFRELLSELNHSGLSVSLDCQWDPEESWEGLGDWLPLVSTFFANSNEVCSITGARSPEEALRKLTQATPNPIVKDGARGVLANDNGEQLRVQACEVALVDTVGAGDSFDAGYLFAKLVLDRPSVDALRYGNAVAARSCSFRGGVGARSTAADVEMFLEDCK